MTQLHVINKFKNNYKPMDILFQCLTFQMSIIEIIESPTEAYIIVSPNIIVKDFIMFLLNK